MKLIVKTEFPAPPMHAEAILSKFESQADDFVYRLTKKGLKLIGRGNAE